MYINIYYDDAEFAVESIKHGSYDTGCGGMKYWNISNEKDKNAIFNLNYSDEKWLIDFSYYDSNINEKSEFGKFIDQFERTEFSFNIEQFSSNNIKKFVYCYTNNPQSLFDKMQYEFKDGEFFLIKLEDNFISPGYSWNSDASYDKKYYGYYYENSDGQNDVSIDVSDNLSDDVSINESQDDNINQEVESEKSDE